MSYCGVDIKDGSLVLEECKGMVGLLIGGVKKEVSCQVAREMEIVGNAIIEVGGRACHLISDVQCKGGGYDDLAYHIIDCSLDSFNWWMLIIFGVLSILLGLTFLIIYRVHAMGVKLTSRMGEKITKKWSRRGLMIRKRNTEDPVEVRFSWRQVLISIFLCRALFDYGLVQETEACTQFSHNLIDGLNVYSASFLDVMEVCVDGYKMNPIMPSIHIQSPLNYLSCDYEVDSHPEEMCGDECGADCGQFEGGLHSCYDGNVTEMCPTKSKPKMGLLKEYRKYCNIHSRNFLACLGHSWGCWKWTSVLTIDPRQCYKIRSLWSETDDFETKILNVSGVDLELMLSPYQKVVGAARDYLVTKSSKSWLCDMDTENIQNIMVHKMEDLGERGNYWWKFNWSSLGCHTKEKESDGLCFGARNFNPEGSSGCHQLPLKYGSYTLNVEGESLVAKASGLWHVRIMSREVIKFSTDPNTCTDIKWAIVGTRTGSLPLYVTVKAHSVDNLEMTMMVSCLKSPVSFKCDGHLHSFEVDSEVCEAGGKPIRSYVMDELEVQSVRQHIDGSVRRMNANLVRGSTLVAIFLIIIVVLSLYRCCVSS